MDLMLVILLFSQLWPSSWLRQNQAKYQKGFNYDSKKCDFLRCNTHILATDKFCFIHYEEYMKGRIDYCFNCSKSKYTDSINCLDCNSKLGNFFRFFLKEGGDIIKDTKRDIKNNIYGDFKVKIGDFVSKYRPKW